MIPRISWPQNVLTAIPWAAVAFLAGVLAHAGSPFERIPGTTIGTVAITAVGITIILPKIWRYGIAALAIGFLGGFLRFDLTIPTAAPEGTIYGMVVSTGKYDVRVRDEATGIGTRLSSTSYRLGERLKLTCSSLVPLDTEDEFSTYHARKGTWFTCKSPSAARLSSTAGWDARGTLLRWRQTLTWRIQRILPGDPGALLAGILYGERNLAEETASTFRAAGMTHLIAVSGSNIALVVSLFVPFFLLLGYRRKPAIILSGAAITTFVIFVGAEASVVRAAIMGWLALLARVFGRKASAGRLLVIAATAIVLVDPWALAFDAGFALSFLATWGLLSWVGPLQEKGKWIPNIAGLREAFATTLAATLITTPYSLWAFGQVSLAGLLTNLLAIPLIGLAMLWGTVALIGGTALPWLALPAKGILTAVLSISHIANVAPWLQASVHVPTWGLFLCYAWCWWRTERRQQTPHAYPQPEITEVNFGGLLSSAVRKNGQSF